ncbi:MAG: RNA methyltransferase [Erysipelothrix sp.]|nr:RNA methyltransferase [Erysipelothrix sp.]
MLITSQTNAKVVAWSKLKQTKHQRQAKQFIIEEKLLIKEAVKANLNCTIIAVVDSDIKADYYVSDAIMKKISTNESLNEVIAVCDFYDIKAENSNKIVYLDNVQDPGNVGTIIRSAYAFGYDQVVLANNSVNKYNHKLIHAAKGAMFHISIVDEINLEDCLNKGYEIFVTALDKKAIDIKHINKKNKMVVVFGNEGSGVSEPVLKLATEKVYIEMNNFDSLNVAVSAGIVLHHFK